MSSIGIPTAGRPRFLKRLADLEDRYESALLAKSLKGDRLLPFDAVVKLLPEAAC